MAGVPDELERLWTPHRMAYITGANPPAGCPFCLAPNRPVDEGLVVARGDAVYAVLNLYPYNPGHLLICPYRHVADYTDLDEAETVELARFSQRAMTVVRRVSGPDGFNLGMNQGAVSGAGVAAHLHEHVVPRWSGDTNFMPIIAKTKTLPQLLADTRALLAGAWADVDAELGRSARPPRFRRATKAPAPTGDGASQAAASGRAASGQAASGQAAFGQAAASKAGKRTAAGGSAAGASGSTGTKRVVASEAAKPAKRSRRAN